MKFTIEGGERTEHGLQSDHYTEKVMRCRDGGAGGAGEL